MPDSIKFLSDAKAAILLNKLAVFRFLLFSFGSLAAATQTALAGMQWSNSDWQTRLMVMIGVLSSWSIAMMAFLDKTMARIALGENPFVDAPPAPGTIEKTVIAQVKTTTTPAESTP